MCQRRLVNQKKKLKTTRRPAPPYHNGLTCTGATAERAAMTARTKVVTLCGGRFAVKAPCVTRIAEPAWRSRVDEVTYGVTLVALLDRIVIRRELLVVLPLMATTEKAPVRGSSNAVRSTPVVGLCVARTMYEPGRTKRLKLPMVHRR